ncbi:MAG: TraR/DksA family transcriptional regulator [Saprospiraceae bacterium]|nr:TraR/DksA family transcriptional regulator [Saprospiraceae bacterium]MBP9193529.1 TraR/DksA family transcriptional regulator [Saprospiraceae bacterium]
MEVRAPKHAKPAVKTAGKVENKVEKKSAVVSAAKGKIVEKATPKKPSKPLPTIDKVQLEKLENSFDNQAKIEYLKEKRNMQPDPPSLPVQTVVHRYNDKDLEEFKAIIDDKLEKARYQYENLIEQIKEITENTSGDFTKDLTDFSSSQSEVEMLNSMATRQRTFISDLQNALVRIRNKTYGICAVTGELIEKKRLIAVPTTTKSVLAKQHGEQAAAVVAAAQAASSKRDLDSEEEEEDTKKKKASEPKKPVIITKVIKKPGSGKSTKKIDDEDDELDEILKDLDSFTEGPEETFEDDIDIADDESTDYEEPYEEGEDDEEA